MTKYVHLNDEKTEWKSAIFTNKPRHVARHDDSILPTFGWYPVEEHKPVSFDHALYRLERDSWELIGDVVHVYYAPMLIDVESRRIVMIRRCDAHRDAILSGGLTFANYRFDTRRTTLLRVLGRCTRAAMDSAVETVWITEDNKQVFMTNDQLQLFGATFEEFEEQNVLYARQLKDIIELSDSPETVDITEGWPSNEFYPDVELTLM